ncbi:MAG: histidine kinase [Fluviicola sp.]|nr:histidine kinase [Fluviicola sp.]
MLVFLLSWSAFESFSQEPYYQNFSFYEGYSFRSVYSILEDHSGFIWFTSDEGLFRYNGTTFKNYKNAQQTSFSGTYLKEDKYGRIWYQTFDGLLYYFEQNKLKQFQTVSTPYFFSFQISDKYIFTLEEKFFAVYDIRTLKLVKKITKKAYFIQTSTLFKGEMFYMFDQQLRKINSDLHDELVINTSNYNLHNTLMCISNDAIYLTEKSNNNNSIYKISNKKLVRICGIEKDVFVQNIQFLNGKIHLTTTDGLHIIDPRKSKRTEVYLKKKNFSAALYDQKNNLWLSSPNDGIYLLSNIKLTRENTFGKAPIRLTMIGNELGFTTKNSEINLLNVKNKTLQSTKMCNINAEGYYLFYNPKDQFLVSGFSDGYTYFKDVKHPQKRTHILKISLKKVLPLDHKYYAIIGTGFAGFMCLTGKEKETSKFDKYILKLTKKEQDGISIYRIENPAFYQRGKSLAFDKKNETLYFATANGLYKWRKGLIQELFVNHSPVVLKSIFCFDGKVIGLKGSKNLIKISAFKDQETKKFEELFKHSDITAIKVFDDCLVIQTQHYLRIFRKNKINRLVEFHKLDISNIEVFDFHIDKQVVWISSEEGLFKWYFHTTDSKRKIGVFQVNQLFANDVSIPLKGHVLDHDQNNISLQYSILDFGNKTIERTYFKLNNGKWQKMEPNSQSLNFSALSPNKYTVYFKGIVYGKPVFFETINFTVAPPFWSTWWFISLVIVCVAIILLVIYKYQINKIILKNKLINEKITLENNLNKSMLTALKSQMNPHFFYNVLNSIQGYVLTGDQQKASESIGLFSDLSRAVLESSRMNEISLHDELELLETYLKLECMRMPKINYQIDIQNDLRLHDLFLPPMILQPFVENAVKHGLANKNGGGHVYLSFSINNEKLVVLIEDDGIGRAAASTIASMKTRKGTSFSTEANRNRIELLNTNFKSKIVYEITDLVDENEVACGTRVKLVIPQNKELS